MQFLTSQTEEIQAMTYREETFSQVARAEGESCVPLPVIALTLVNKELLRG